mgnify:CR=1 FL=1
MYIENDSLKILDLQKNTVIGIPNIKSYKVKFKTKRPIKNYSIGGFQTPIEYKYYQK